MDVPMDLSQIHDAKKMRRNNVRFTSINVRNNNNKKQQSELQSDLLLLLTACRVKLDQISFFLFVCFLGDF